MTIITAADIQKGDLIKVTTISNDEDRKVSYVYEGVASEQDSWNPLIWRTTSFSNLWAHEAGAVIELLDRPKPKIVLPDSVGAVVKYVRENGARFAVRNGGDDWMCYDENGVKQDARSTKELSDMLARRGWAHEVLFAGVAK